MDGKMNYREYKEYIEEMKQRWIGKKVLYEGSGYTVVDVDYNGALLIDKPSQFNRTTAVSESMVKEIKPIVHFNSRGHSGNIFWILGAAQVELHKLQRITDYNNLRERVTSSGSYEEALSEVRKDIDLIDDDGIY